MNNMTDNLMKNKFIDFIIQYHKYIQNLPKTESENKIQTSNSKFLFWKKDIEKPKDIDNNETKRINELKKYVFEESFIKNGILFDSLFDFCQFVKYAEKVYFYNNIPDTLFYVDSNLDDVEHSFVISDYQPYSKFQFMFKLEKVMDKITDQELQVIKITAKRNFGREMTNQFIIVNSSVKYNDISDMYLMEIINKILLERLRLTYGSIINTVKEMTE